MIYLAYLRKSRLQAGQRSVSIEEQQAAITAWAERKNAQLEWFIDVDKSGQTEARPEWQRLLTRLADPEPQGVVIYDSTKTHRNLREYLAFYDDILAPLGRELVDINNPALNLDTADGRLTGSILGAAAEHHARRTSELMVNKLAHIRQAQGRHLGPIPFGCDRDPTTKHLIPTAATYLLDGESRRYFDALHGLYEIYVAHDISYLETARLVNDAGWRCWQRDHHTPARFNGRNVQRILQQSHLYAGGWQPDGWQADYAPILPPELCRAVTAQVARRSFVRDPRCNPDRIYLLSGLLYCGECGTRLAGQNSNSSYRGKQYRYAYYRHTYPVDHCQQPGIDADDLETQVIRRIMALLEGPPLIDLLELSASEILAELTARQQPDVSELHQAEAELERLIDLHVSGLISREQFTRRRDPLQRRLEELQARPGGQVDLPALEALVTALRDWLPRLPEADPAGVRLVIRDMVERIEVTQRTVSRLAWAGWLVEFLEVAD